MIPNIFYITEKAWNYFPYTVTEYTVSIRLKYELDGLGSPCLRVAGRKLELCDNSDR